MTDYLYYIGIDSIDSKSLKKDDIPKIHFSSPKDKKNKRSHNDYINVDDFIDFLEKIKFTNKDFDVMIEAKKKDDALFRLIRELKYKTDYKIEKNTIFL
jgi:UV DNA damage endonuclease